MKRIIAAACLLFGIGMLAAQTSVPIPQREAHGRFTATGSSSVIDQQGTGIAYHSLRWKLGGTVPATTCTIKVEKSDDNVTFADGFAAVNCADGQTRIKQWTFFSARYIKITLVTFSGGTSPTIDYEYVGAIIDPSSTGAGSGGLTDAELRATPVPVSGTVTSNAGTGTFVVGDGAGALNTIVDSGAVTATLAAETTKVIGTVNQGTSPWVSANSAATPSLQAVTADVDAAVAAATNLRLRGIIYSETAGAAASFRIVHGATVGGGTVVIPIITMVGTSSAYMTFPDGIAVASGVSIDWVSGTLSIVVLYSVN